MVPKVCIDTPVVGTRMLWLLLFSIWATISLDAMSIAFAEERAKDTQLESARLMAQLAIPDSNHIQVIETTDASTNVGRIVQIGDEEIAFETDLGTIHIPISKIKHIETVPVTSIHDGEIWFKNPNTTRLFFAPTARMLEQGRGYFSDYYLFFPGFAYGVTDRFTLGGGVSIFPGVAMDEQLFFFAPKFGLVQEDPVQFSVGALLVRVPDEHSVVGILYGVTTFGQPDASLTAGLGYGFVDGDLADHPMVMVGGEKRLTRRIAFVSENWIFPGVDETLISYGLRFFGRRLSVDLALINMIGEEAFFPGVPYIDFVVQF